MLDKAKREVALGQAEIRTIIKVPKAGNIAGDWFSTGAIKRGAEARLIRDSVVIYTGKVDSLRRFKEDVGEVKQGFECGILLDRYQDIKIGDVIEAYRNGRGRADGAVGRRCGANVTVEATAIGVTDSRSRSARRSVRSWAMSFATSASDSLTVTDVRLMPDLSFGAGIRVDSRR